LILPLLRLFIKGKQRRAADKFCGNVFRYILKATTEELSKGTLKNGSFDFVHNDKQCDIGFSNELWPSQQWVN